jgi:hypothetical protein
VALNRFDPDALGRLEQRAWAVYYLRDWPALFRLLYEITRRHFGLSLPQALYATFLATRAQVRFARSGNQDGRAEADMRLFYAFVRGPAGGRYDSARAARLELGWWVVHRQRERYPDRRSLSAALAASYAEVYQRPIEAMMPAAEARAEAMDLSDQWVREGRQRGSPLLRRIAELLVDSYRALHEATARPGTPATETR